MYLCVSARANNIMVRFVERFVRGFYLAPFFFLVCVYIELVSGGRGHVLTSYACVCVCVRDSSTWRWATFLDKIARVRHRP